MAKRIEAVHAARDQLYVALEQHGFREEIERLAREHPPTASAFDTAISEPNYGKAVEQLARFFELDAPWFHRFVHENAANATHRFAIKHGHELPQPWAVMWASFEWRALRDEQLVPEPANGAFVLWATTRKEEAWQQLRSSFDRFWEDEVAPAQQQQSGYTERTRISNALLRDAQAYLIRAELRRDPTKRPDDLPGAVAAELRRRHHLQVRDPASLDRALARFATLIFRSDM